MVLLVDLDRFKQVNDELGHLVGDRVLVEVARRLADAIRATDMVARFGGDEFAVLLAGGTGAPRPEEMAARIRAAVARPVEVPGRSLQVGVTVGWAQADRRDTDPMALLQRADARLYAAKAARPARSTRSPSGTEPPAADVAADGTARSERPELREYGRVGPAGRVGPGPDPGREREWAPIWTGVPVGVVRAHDGDAHAPAAR
jgi:diguanylate cyclase (GGDEF)-like protein